MKKWIAWMVAALLAVSLSACNKTPYTGTEKGDAREYAIEFSALNAEKQHQLSLESGDTLQVTIVQTSGNIRLFIRDQDGVEAYAGNRLSSCAFTVGIAKAGEYTVTVEGESAYGSVEVKAAAPATPDSDSNSK